MTLKEALSKIENGSRHILLYDSNGVILYDDIWQNNIEKETLEKEIVNLEIKDYELRIEIK